jgi:hypothetical protein
MDDRPLRRPGPKAVDAQEDVCAILYAFANRLGAPISNPEGYEIGSRRADLRQTLAEIAHAYGYEIMEIQ